MPTMIGRLPKWQKRWEIWKITKFIRKERNITKTFLTPKPSLCAAASAIRGLHHLTRMR